MPDPALLTPLGKQFIADLPPHLRDEPSYIGTLHAQAREIERFEGKVEELRANFWPATATELGMRFHEAQLGLPTDPAGEDIEARRTVVGANYLKMAGTPAGRDWELNVERIVGVGWTYLEYDPDDPTGPPADTIRIFLPGDVTTARFAQAERLIRAITPAAWDLEITPTGGFVLDQSQLDQAGLG